MQILETYDRFTGDMRWLDAIDERTATARDIAAAAVRIRPEMASTRTYEDFSKFLGTNPARLGIVSSLYDQYTACLLYTSPAQTWASITGKPTTLTGYGITDAIKNKGMRILPFPINMLFKLSPSH